MTLQSGVGRVWIGAASLAATLAIATPSISADDATTVSTPDLKVGDAWVMDETVQKGANGFNERRLQVTVDRVGEDSVEVGVKQDGSPSGAEDHLFGRDWSVRHNVDGREEVTGRPLSFPLQVGKRWSTDFTENGKGRVRTVHWHIDYTATGWEDVDTAAGKLHAVRIEGKAVWKADLAPMSAAVGGVVTTGDSATTVSSANHDGARQVSGISYRVWDYAPAAKQFAKWVVEDYDGSDVRTRREVVTLASYKPGS